jgi:hypothetical protein
MLRRLAGVLEERTMRVIAKKRPGKRIHPVPGCFPFSFSKAAGSTILAGLVLFVQMLIAFAFSADSLLVFAAFPFAQGKNRPHEEAVSYNPTAIFAYFASPMNSLFPPVYL